MSRAARHPSTHVARPAAVVAAAILTLPAGAGVAAGADGDAAVPAEAAGAGPVAAFTARPASGGANVAHAGLGGVVTGVSSENDDVVYSARHVIDGATGHHHDWLAFPGDAAPWVTLALPRARTVNDVRLAEAVDHPDAVTGARVTLGAAGTTVDVVDATLPEGESVATASTGAAAVAAVDEVRVDLWPGAGVYAGVGEVELLTGEIGGREVAFADASSPGDAGAAVSRAWDFGDGATSADASPTHVFPGPGDYPVTLTVTDAAGISASVTRTQTVLDPVVLDIRIPQPVLEGRYVQPVDASDYGSARVAVDRAWSAEPGGVSVIANGGAHTLMFPEDGPVDLTHTVTDSAGLTSSTTVRVEVANVPPGAGLRTPEEPARPGVPYPLAAYASDSSPEDAAGLTCVLDPGDGRQPLDLGACAGAFDVPVVYPRAGTYTASLTVTDPVGASDTAHARVVVGEHLATDLSISLGDGADHVRPGDVVTQHLLLTNNGPHVAEEAGVYLALPQDVLDVRAADGGQWDAHRYGQWVTWPARRLEVGASFATTVTYRVAESVEHGTVLRADARATQRVAGGEDPRPDDNQATDLTEVRWGPGTGTSWWFLTGGLRGEPRDLAEAIAYGPAVADAYLGDFDGDGVDTPAYRSAGVLHVRGDLGDDAATVTYGRPGEVLYVGDFDGDGTDTFAVRRGNAFLVSNSPAGGEADVRFHYGRVGEEALVGDFDGDGIDTVAVRRGNAIHVRDSLTSGAADRVFWYGRPGEPLLVGDFDGDGIDTFAVRRGDQVHVRNSLTSGRADAVTVFGRVGDEVLVGDVDGDGRDTLGIRVAVGG